METGITIPSITKCVKWAVELLLKQRFEKIENRRKYFDDHIKPTFETLEVVHKDYQSNFEELIRVLRSEQWVTDNIVRWLEDRRAEYRAERELLRAVNLEFENSSYYEKSRKSSTAKDYEIYKASFKFAKSIILYFDGSNYMECISWYGYLIEKLEFYLELTKPLQNFKPKPYDIATKFDLAVGGGVGDVIKEIQPIIDKLPKHYKEVCKAYSKLRGLCLT